jgi:hypothetical protein
MKITITTDTFPAAPKWGLVASPDNASLYVGKHVVRAVWRETAAKRTVELKGVVFGDPIGGALFGEVPKNPPRVDVTVEAPQ